MKKMNILWIDDNPSRKRDIGDVVPDFRSVNNKTVPKELTKIKSDYDKKKKTPNLIIIDQVLDKIKKEPNTANLFTSGASISLMLREFWPKTPIVGISAVSKFKNIDLNKKDVFDDFIDGNELSGYEGKLIVIAKTFYKERKTSISQKAQIIKRLKAPSDLSEKLALVLPCNLLQDDGKQLFRLYKWINNILFGHPGFLYDRLWASTYLGLTLEGFEKIENVLSEAKYKGIFANDKDEHWWPIKINEIISKKIKVSGLYYTWQKGRQLPGITKRCYSKCRKCGKVMPEPEIVAYTDSTRRNKASIHVSCTEELKDIEKMLFFEDLRVMKDDHAN